MESESPLPLAMDALRALGIPFAQRGQELRFLAACRRGQAPVVLRCGAGRFALYARLPGRAVQPAEPDARRRLPGCR